MNQVYDRESLKEVGVFDLMDLEKDLEKSRMNEELLEMIREENVRRSRERVGDNYYRLLDSLLQFKNDKAALDEIDRLEGEVDGIRVDRIERSYDDWLKEVPSSRRIIMFKEVSTLISSGNKSRHCGEAITVEGKLEFPENSNPEYVEAVTGELSDPSQQGYWEVIRTIHFVQ